MRKQVKWFIIISLLFFGCLACMSGKKEVQITEMTYMGSPHFKVVTPLATYMIEKQSGGCSALLDREGNDWIAFRQTGDNPPLNSADSDWRGLPNLVFRGEDNGVGHPGFQKCTTELENENQLHVRSLSGQWEFVWEFYRDHALLTVEKTDTSRAYWFLYEGPVAGKFSPESHYWGNDKEGMETPSPDYKEQAHTGNWQWVYIGDQGVDRVLYLSMPEGNDVPGFFAYFGNDPASRLNAEDGMTVFGFGREPRAKPRLVGNQQFLIGFYEHKILTAEAHRDFRDHLQTSIKSIRDGKD